MIFFFQLSRLMTIVISLSHATHQLAYGQLFGGYLDLRVSYI